MSVYSGFPTRKEEHQYGKLTEQLVSLLSAKHISSIRDEPFDDRYFSAQIIKIYKKMSQLELHKHLPPVVSKQFYDLANYCATSFPISKTVSPRDHSKKQPPYHSIARNSPLLPVLERNYKTPSSSNRSHKKARSQLERGKPNTDDQYFDGMFFSKLS